MSNMTDVVQYSTILAERKIDVSELLKVNLILHHNKRRNVLYKHRFYRYWRRGFCFKAFWRLKNMLKASTLSSHAGIVGDRLLELYFLPPRLIGAVYHDFVQNAYPESCKMWIFMLGFIYGTRIKALHHIFFLHLGHSWTKCLQKNG